MQHNSGSDDEVGVSSIIGVILMVVIVVIIGSIVSVFALGIADDIGSSSPQVVFDFTYDDTTGDVMVSKKGGDSIHGDQLRFAGAALEKDTFGGITEWAGAPVEISDPATVNVRGGETLKVMYRSSDGGKTWILAEYDVPADASPSGTLSITNIQSVDDKISIEVGTLSKIDGDANLVVETASGKVSQTVTSGATVTLSPQIKGIETVTATLYESGETGKIASDSGSAPKEASIGSIQADHFSQYIDINDIQFNGVEGDSIYVVLEDEDGQINERKEVTTNGKNLTVDVGSNYYVSDSETITATVYETNTDADAESNALTTSSTTAT